MSKPAPKKIPPKKRSRRINVKGLAYFGVTLAVIGVLYFPIKVMADRKARTSALAQAKLSVEKGDVDLALRHINGYLASWPDDIPALEEKAKLMSESARGPIQILEAANLNDQLIRLDPSGPGRRETRRKLAELYIRYSDAARNYATLRPDMAKAAHETRYIAAINVARHLLGIEKPDPKRKVKEKPGPEAIANQKLSETDAVSHRLLAMALEGQVVTGDAKGESIGLQLDEARKEYEEALRIDPRDVIASERLAELYLLRLNDPAAAEETLDEMLKANPASVEVRMARYKVYSQAKPLAKDKAKAELEAAIALAPENYLIRLEAASEALGRLDPAAARRHLEAIPAAHQDDLRVRFLRGNVDMAEQRPEEAIEEWRKGLSIAGGTDLELNWSLARTLIQLGRLGEAKPLVAQFQRLDNDESSGMGRFLRAMLEESSGHPARAIEDLDRIPDRVAPSLKTEVQLSLGRCYEALGDETRALIAFRRAATLVPQSPAPRRAIARLLQPRDSDQAISELEAALTRSPDDLAIINDLIRLRLVRQLVLPAGQRQWREVVDYLDRAEKIAPGNGGILTLRAEYLAASGRLAEAVELLGKAAQGPNRKRPEIWLNWANALIRSNRREEAIQALEQASAADAAGEHASLRIARSRLLARSGKGQAAREILSKDLESVPTSERPELFHELGNLLRDMGDRDGARAAFAEWARLAPDNPSPSLALLDLARVNDDDQAAKLGLEGLHRLGGDQEPYGLAAQVLELFRTDRSRPSPLSKEKLEDADRLVSRLQAEAPQLTIGYLLKGMVLEQKANLEEAAVAYRKAMKDEGAALALPRLVEVLTKLKRFEELDAMKRKFDEQTAIGQQPGIATEFDRISASVALKLGDKERLEYFANQIVEAQPDNVQARASLAQLLDRLGKPKEAEATLQALVDRKPQEPSSWLTLIAYLAPRHPRAEVVKAIEKARAIYKGERSELLLGQCYWLANDLPSATRLYKAALDKQPKDPATLRGAAEFDEGTNQLDELESILKTALKVDPKATWASRTLALRISARLDPSTWAEAWALVAPGAPGSGDFPEDRMIRATLLARSPLNARRAEAIPAFAALANDLPSSNPVGLEARLRLAQAMLEANRGADAWSFIAPVADDVNRPNPMALSIAVEALVLTGRPDEAQRRLDRLVALEPKSPRTAWSKAWVLMSKGQKEEASASIQSAFTNAEAAPEAEPIGMNCVDLLLKFGDVEAADKVAKQIAARWPRDSWLLARVQLARKEYDLALASCRVAIDAGSTREALRLATSSAIARRADSEFLKKVELLGVEAKAKSPKDFNVLVFLATIYHLQDRYEEEVSLYRQALELNPPNVQFLNNMAWTLCEGLHKPEEALTRIDEAIRREGVNPQYLDTRGVIRGRLGMDDQSIVDLELSAKGDPSPTTYFHLARAYLKAGRAEDRRRCRDLALKAKFDSATLDPTDRAEMNEVMGNP